MLHLEGVVVGIFRLADPITFTSVVWRNSSQREAPRQTAIAPSMSARHPRTLNPTSSLADRHPLYVHTVRLPHEVLLYVHRDHKDLWTGEPSTTTSTSTQLLSSDIVQCCFTSTETIRTIMDGGTRHDHLDFHTAPELS